jgi:thioredoxin-like negative regulator of GroEL
MIEVLIEAERALTHGLIDQAERLYRQVAENDPKSSIAVMGLARVALERGDDRTAYLHGRAALAIDAENPAAQHLVMRLTEVMAGRGETPPSVEPPLAAETPPALERSRPTGTGSPGLLGRLIGRRRRPR